MKFVFSHISFSALASLISASAFAAPICNVYVESTSHNYDQKIVQMAQPTGGQSTMILVDVPNKTATKVSAAELKSHLDADDFKGWNGKTLVTFTKEKDGRSIIDTVEVDTQKPYAEMRYTLAMGQVTPKFSLGLLNGEKRFHANCSNRKFQPKL